MTKEILLEKPKILIVDDRPENLFALESILDELDVELVKVNSGNDALKATLNNRFALAILDVQMPGMDGYELARLLRNSEKTMFIPIIFLSAVYSDDFHIFKGYKSGALDFLTKPHNPEILIEKAKIFLEQYRDKNKLEVLVNELKETNEKLQLEISQRKKAEEQVNASLKEKEVLLKEVHHRVKNNMQVISSLLNLQAKRYDDKKVIDILSESRNRIKSMALIHEGLYQTKDFANITFAEYVKSLVTHLMRSNGVDTDSISTDIDIKDILLGIDTSIPCGLILNELVSNSLKHAFREGVKGEIRISMKKIDDFGLRLPADKAGNAELKSEISTLRSGATAEDGRNPKLN